MMESKFIGASLLAVAVYVGIIWFVARIFQTTSNEIETDFEELKAREKQ